MLELLLKIHRVGHVQLEVFRRIPVRDGGRDGDHVEMTWRRSREILWRSYGDPIEILWRSYGEHLSEMAAASLRLATTTA